MNLFKISMKNICCLLLLTVLMVGKLSAQSDNCATATVVSVTANCTTPTPGTTAAGTPSIYSGCVGNADDDVWYQFTASGTSHEIDVIPSSGMDAVVQLFSGTCGALTTLSCMDAGLSGQTEIIYATGLTAGTIYLVRVYNYGAGAGSGNFTICITNPPPAPANNTCAGAVALTVTANCSNTAGTTIGATQSLAGCVGTADDDVWYKFVATNSTATITVNPSSTMDAVVQLYSGACGSLSSINCEDNTLTNGNEVISPIGLVVGSTYYVRVYDYYGGNGGQNFSICVTGPPSSNTPTNDNPCSAIPLPAVTSDCNYSHFTTTGATASTGAPTPTTCGGTAPQQGGFTSSSKDVWFSVVAPANGKITINPQPGYGINDGVLVLYSGTCGSLTQIACNDDHNYPGTANDVKPYISKSGLTPGTTYFIRYFGYGTTSGNFGLCVSSPTNDACSSALYICDLNGYSASTSAAYTPDRPCNMYANNETQAGVDQPDGTNTGGIFGKGGSWGTGSPNIDVNINNNSWITFTAGATTAILNVTIGNCWVGNYPSGGVQMQIFSGTNCCNFTPVSNFKENSTGFTITANSLTIGNTYYLMVDGFAGDICNYKISANSGVQFPAITAVPSSVCNCQSTTLTGPSGATYYLWSPGGLTTQSITVTPSTTITYTCIASGVCGFKQTLTKTITVNPPPTITVNSPTICGGQSGTLTASGATTYTWSTGATGASINVNPSATTTYTVTGTTSGCTNTATATVVVNLAPTMVNPPTPSPSNCNQSTGSLTGATFSGSNTLTYSWTNSSNTVVGTSVDLLNQPAGTYNITVTDPTGCAFVFGPYSIVNPSAPPPPTITANDTTVCIGSPIVLTASSSASNPTYTWTGPNSTGNQPTLTIPSATPADSGPYAVTVTSNNCTGAAAIVNVVVLPPPFVDATNASSGTMCSGNTIYLVSTGGVSYSWTGPNSFSSNAQNVAFTNATTAINGIYTVSVTDANGCVGTDTTLINISQTPAQVVASDFSTCSGAPLNLVASGTGTINWYSDAALTNLVQGNSSTYTPTIPDATTAVYYVVATNNGCTSQIAVVNVSNFNINAVASADVMTGYVPITVNFTNSSTGVDGSDNYLWVFGDSTIATTYDASHYYTTGGHFNVMLIITETTSGCVDTAILNCFYDDVSILVMPNIFTPNGDNINDIYTYTGHGIKTFKIDIFDRWGIKMHHWDSLSGAWDGRTNTGAAASSGTYFYILEATAYDGKNFDLHGAFQLER